MENSFKITLFNRNYLLNQDNINEETFANINFLLTVHSAPRKEIQDYLEFTKEKTIGLLNRSISENLVIKEGESISMAYSLKNR